MKKAKKIFIIIYIINFFLFFIEQINTSIRTNIAEKIFLFNTVIMLILLLDAWLLSEVSSKERENQIFGISKEERQFDDNIIKREIEKYDAKFKTDEFKNYTKNLLIEVINRYKEKKLEEIRNFITPEMFENYKLGQNDIGFNGFDKVKKICSFEYIKLYSFRKNADKDELSVVIRLNVEEKPKNFWSRYSSNKKTRLYILEFIRKLDDKLVLNENMLSNAICPNCGAIEEMTSTGKCNFCESILLSNSYNWSLNSIKDFSWENYIKFVNCEEVYVEKEPEINETAVEKEIKKSDRNFNKKLFYSFSKLIFAKFQNAWSKADLLEIRGLETEELFKKHKYELQKFITTSKRDIKDLNEIEYVKLFKFSKTQTNDLLEVLIKAKMKQLVVDADTMEYMYGENKIETYYYRVQFIRDLGQETLDKEIVSINCPNCGAPLKTTIVGKCEYCKKTVTTGKYGWVLNNITKIKENLH